MRNASRNRQATVPERSVAVQTGEARHLLAHRGTRPSGTCRPAAGRAVPLCQDGRRQEVIGT